MKQSRKGRLELPGEEWAAPPSRVIRESHIDTETKGGNGLSRETYEEPSWQRAQQVQSLGDRSLECWGNSKKDG